ncbi:MAG: hypothetical protein ABIH76_03595 [Candidatus Bathyarchaeota archaeon]
MTEKIHSEGKKDMGRVFGSLIYLVGLGVVYVGFIFLAQNQARLSFGIWTGAFLLILHGAYLILLRDIEVVRKVYPIIVIIIAILGAIVVLESGLLYAWIFSFS